MLTVKQPQFVWIHLKDASKAEISQIQKEYDFHELIVEDI